MYKLIFWLKRRYFFTKLFLKSIIRFFRLVNVSKRALPDFIIIGVQKGGTSSLFSYLSQHPQLKLSLTKEVHYFDNNYNKGLKWYKCFFPIIKKGILTGEASPYYFYHPLVPSRIKKDVPDAKFILLLRNPVSRAFSSFNMIKNMRPAHEPAKNFEEAINLEETRLKGEEEKMIQNPKYQSQSHLTHAYFNRGLYHKQLTRWLEHFPKEQFLILKSETFYEKPLEELAKVYNFLGIQHIFPENLTPKMVGKYSSQLKPATIQQLEDAYYEDNRKLVELLGEDFRWVKEKDTTTKV